MEFSISIPVDADGFLRRECPNCIREFKWFDGRAEGTPDDWQDPDQYFCPYCGNGADSNDFLTQAHVTYIEEMVAGHALDLVEGELGDTLRSFNRNSGFIKMDLSIEDPGMPPVLGEPNDMDAIEPPCHPFEPLKVLDASAGPFHCLVCGLLFEIED